MFRFLFAFVLVFTVTAPALAQTGEDIVREVIEESSGIVLPTFALLGVIIAVLSTVMVIAIRNLANSAPPWVGEYLRLNREEIARFVDEQLGEALKQRAAQTPNTLDDRIAQYIDEKLPDVVRAGLQRPDDQE